MQTGLIEGAYDIHVHCAPDMLARSEDIIALAEAARNAKMGGMIIKDHCTSTIGRCYTMNHLFPEGPIFAAALALNPTVRVAGILTRLRRLWHQVLQLFISQRMVHVVTLSDLALKRAPGPLPIADDYPGDSIFSIGNQIRQDVKDIVALIAQYDAVLATGHLSPDECLHICAYAAEHGVKRMVVTHASEVVPGMSILDQQEINKHGVFIEHSFLAATPCCGGELVLPEIAAQIHELGSEHVILSSDFGQTQNGPIVPGFIHYVQRMYDFGFNDEDLRVMICQNPHQLVDWERYRHVHIT